MTQQCLLMAKTDNTILRKSIANRWREVIFASFIEATLEMLGLFLDFLIQERHGHAGKGQKVIKGLEHLG